MDSSGESEEKPIIIDEKLWVPVHGQDVQKQVLREGVGDLVSEGSEVLGMILLLTSRN